MSEMRNNPEEILAELRATAVMDRARRLEGFGDSRQALGGLIDYATKLTAKDAASAVDATDIVVNLADRVGTQLDRARARRARARALSYTGRFDESLLVSREGIRLAEESGDLIEAGRSRLASMHALGELGRLDEAIAVGEAAREMFLQAGEPTLAGRADINLGVAYQRTDDPKMAVACFERAKKTLSDDLSMLGPIETNRGEALFALNDFEGAERAFAAALSAMEATGSTLTAAIVEGNLADVAARRGKLNRAMFHFERARRKFESAGAAGHLARLLAEQAEALNVLGMPRDALRAYEDALVELDRCGLPLEAARARAGMGLALLRLGRLAQSETSLAAAAVGFDELGHDTARAKTDLLRAELALRSGRHNDAVRMALKSLAALHERAVDAIDARHLLARISLATGKLSEADAELHAAMNRADVLELSPLKSELLFTRGVLRRRQNRESEAIGDFAEAIEQAERVRGTLQAERFRAAYLGERSSLYESLVDLLLEQSQPGDCERALAVVEQIKGRTLLERVRGLLEETDDVGAECRASADSDLLNRISGVRAELSALYSTMNDDRRGKGSATDAKLWRELVRQCEERLDQLESRAAATAGVGVLYSRPVDAGRIRSCVGQGAAMIEYGAVGDELIAFVVTADGVKSFRKLASVTEVSKTRERLHFQINRALRPGALAEGRRDRLIADARRELSALHGMLVEPLARALEGFERLIVVPHGVLHGVPFHALWDGKGYLVERFDVHTVPSASLYVHLTGRSASAESRELGGMRNLVVGVADEYVPGIVEEARSVAAMVGAESSELLLDAEATRERVRAAMEGAGVVHLACHGRFSMETPLGSGLKLADGWLTVRDIYSLRLKARLVTLSGCETGVNLVNAGDDIMGLLRGFLAAGAQSVLASLWRVDDETTREFMSEFYGASGTNNQRSESVVRSVRAAQREMLARHQHPALWAPFIMVGKE